MILHAIVCLIQTAVEVALLTIATLVATSIIYVVVENRVSR
jgi:hypothetical protein